MKVPEPIITVKISCRGRFLVRENDDFSRALVMTDLFPSAVYCVHFLAFLGWMWALLHRAARGPVITGHSLRRSARFLGLLLVLFTGIFVLHREPALLSVALPRLKIAVIALALVLDHFVFNRPASATLYKMTLITGAAYLGLCAPPL